MDIPHNKPERKNIFAFHLGIFAVYGIFFFLLMQAELLAGLVFLGVLVIHTITLLAIGADRLIRKRFDSGGKYILCGLTIAIVSFGACSLLLNSALSGI